jgi:hypothetical protein
VSSFIVAGRATSFITEKQHSTRREIRQLILIEDVENLQRDDTNRNLTSDNKRVGIEFPIDNVGIVELAVFFFDKAIHGIQRVESVGLLLAMNQNCVGKLWSTLLHSYNIVGQVDFLGVLSVREGENTLAVNIVKLLHFGYSTSEILIRRKRA